MGSKLKFLLLRGQVPTDRDPRQIQFNSLSECDDMWTHLVHEMSRGCPSEVWYWGGKRTVQYNENFRERWMENFKSNVFDFDPDVIFARGGFKEYDDVLFRHPRSLKIYYGAGQRFVPNTKFQDYNLVIVDCDKQLDLVKFPSTIFIKPAAPVFCPMYHKKKYDIIFVGNEHPKGIKGHNFVLDNTPKSYSILQVGIVSSETRKKYPHVQFLGWQPRKKLPKLYGMAKFAVVANTHIDSCPRVIPESLACGCPILALDRINFWHEKYITPDTGMLCSLDSYVDSLSVMLKNYKLFSAYDYYQKHLSLEVSSTYLLNKLKEKNSVIKKN